MPFRVDVALGVDYFDPKRSREWSATKTSLIAAKREATRFEFPIFRVVYGNGYYRYLERAPGKHDNRKPWREIGVERFRELREV